MSTTHKAELPHGWKEGASDAPEAEGQIAAQAQERSTCPVCKGEGTVYGRSIVHSGGCRVQCPNPKCDEGTVPAGPQADLAAWAAEAERQLDEIVAWYVGELGTSITPRLGWLRAHLAAMPAQDPNAELLGALKRCLLFINDRDSFEDRYGGPEFPESNINVDAWIDRLLLAPARDAIAQAEQGAAG